MRLGIGMTFLLGMMLASPLLGHAEEEDWMPEEKKHLAGAKPSQSPKRPAEPKKAIGTAAEPKKEPGTAAEPKKEPGIALLLPLGQDCQVDSVLTETAASALKPLYRVRKLGTEQVLAPLQAAAAVAAACPQESGFLLGGYVQKLAQGKRARVWALHGPSGSQQPVVMDVYCDRPGCDLSSQLDKAVWAVANHQTPPRDVQPWSARPTFCTDPTAPPIEKIERSGKVVLAVYGDKLPKGLSSALGQELGYKKLIAAPKQRLGQEGLVALLEGDSKGQVLMIEHSAEATAVSLYDVLTKQSYQEPKLVQCAGCTADRLISKITESAKDHLAHCFDKECPQSARIPPEEACQPWATPICADSLPGKSQSGRYIDPNTAKWMQAGVWGLFAASAATTVTLAILNQTSVGDVTLDGVPYHKRLTGHAWLGFGFSALSLAVAIPTTLVADRAKKTSAPRGILSTALSCPTQ
jgi:hypothetical protein